jgi:tripartite-type tricarboxylate transporter receptor subunit TctC
MVRGTLLADCTGYRKAKLLLTRSEVLLMTPVSRMLVLLVSAIVLMCAPARATDWPTKPVTIVVPFGAGGNTDMMARLAAQHLTEKFGQPFVVENRPGAGGALGTGQVAAAAPDGYTLLFSAAANIVLTPQVQKLNFDPLKQLAPITNMGTGTQMIAINNDLPVKTLPEFIAYAKANPGKLNYSVAGTNNISHLAPVLLFARAGIELVMVPAKSEPLAIADVMAGQTNFYFGNSSSLLPQVRAGKLRVIAVGTAERIPERILGAGGDARRHHGGDRQCGRGVCQVARDLEAPVRPRHRSGRIDQGTVGGGVPQGLRVVCRRRESGRHSARQIAIRLQE